MGTTLGKGLGKLKFWNAFKAKEQEEPYNIDYGPIVQPNAGPLFFGRSPSDKNIINSIYNQIAQDVCDYDIKHVYTDDYGKYLDDYPNSYLNHLFQVEANVDQTGRSLFKDAILTMFKEGVVAIVPVDTTDDPRDSESYQIKSLRVGIITAFHPYHVDVELYNERTGTRETVTLPKNNVAIIENPMYSIMNDNGSVLQQLKQRFTDLDLTTKQMSSGQLDLVIQLPYPARSEQRREQAKKRKEDIEDQLYNSPYGIAYIDSSEKITQLNRPVENNLMKQIEYLTSMLYSQLGMSEEIFKGTATESVLLNYYNRTIEPILTAFVEELNRKFLSQTARTQGQRIIYQSNPFKFLPASQLAEVADKFTRNAILTANEFRGIIGYPPDTSNPASDVLENKNLYSQTGQQPMVNEGYYDEAGEGQNDIGGY